jgi:cyclophilin family peptidyl-prolyl cis-trans isomerase
VPRAEKRQRKKDNARAARAEREAAVKRRKRMRTAISVAAVAVAFVVIVLIINLITGDDGNDVAADSTSTTAATDTSGPAGGTTCQPDAESTTTATITTNFGDITAVLDTTKAPIGAGHFADLARDGFYDNLTWHRVVKDFVIQGGDPKGDGTGGSGTEVMAEVPSDNYPIGSLAAAKSPAAPAGSFDSQFFIVTGSGGATLANDYARFGCVTGGIEIAKQIEALYPDTPGNDGPPKATATIEKIVISDTDGGTTTTAPAPAP